jgi:hypothetical protein
MAEQQNSPDPKKVKAFDVAVDTRKLEIQLFWSRSIFFWGFIASAFVGYATLRQHDSDLSVVVACFGVVCSVAWTLVNRGSKYWQEAWETKVERLEPFATGPLFSVEEKEQIHKGCWLRGRRFSVSKLAIGLSDFTVLLWLCIVTTEMLRLFAPPNVYSWLKHPLGPAAFVVVSAIFVVLLLALGRSSQRPSKEETTE